MTHTFWKSGTFSRKMKNVSYKKLSLPKTRIFCEKIAMKKEVEFIEKLLKKYYKIDMHLRGGSKICPKTVSQDSAEIVRATRQQQHDSEETTHVRRFHWVETRDWATEMQSPTHQKPDSVDTAQLRRVLLYEQPDETSLSKSETRLTCFESESVSSNRQLGFYWRCWIHNYFI